MTNNKNAATFPLTDDASGKSYKLPVLHGSLGPSVIDVRKLYAETGHFTYEPGSTSTGSCESGLTFIGGDAGILLPRGHSIHEVDDHSAFADFGQLRKSAGEGKKWTGRE